MSERELESQVSVTNVQTDKTSVSAYRRKRYVQECYLNWYAYKTITSIMNFKEAH